MGLTFQELILNLSKFWSDYGCIIQQPYDIERAINIQGKNSFYSELRNKLLMSLKQTRFENEKNM